jgi:hypothetical protein
MSDHIEINQTETNTDYKKVVLDQLKEENKSNYEDFIKCKFNIITLLLVLASREAEEPEDYLYDALVFLLGYRGDFVGLLINFLEKENIDENFRSFLYEGIFICRRLVPQANWPKVTQFSTSKLILDKLILNFTLVYIIRGNRILFKSRGGNDSDGTAEHIKFLQSAPGQNFFVQNSARNLINTESSEKHVNYVAIQRTGSNAGPNTPQTHSQALHINSSSGFTFRSSAIEKKSTIEKSTNFKLAHPRVNLRMPGEAPGLPPRTRLFNWKKFCNVFLNGVTVAIILIIKGVI